MLRLSISIIVAFLGSISTSFAQEPEIAPTPRQTFTSFISDTPIPDLRFKPYSAKAQTRKTVINTLPNAPILPEGPAGIPEKSPEEHPAPKTASLPEPAKPEPGPEKAAAEKPDPSLPLPFYTTAKDYIRARGSEKQTQLTLTYTVRLANAVNGLKMDPKTVTLLLGPDYAAVTREDTTRLYDFKMQRLLTLRGTGKNRVFDNISLFPGALKAINTVNGATLKGKRSSIPIGPDKTLDAFWLESGIGWSARPDIKTLEVNRSGSKITSTYNALEPLTLDLGGPEMPSEDHMRVLFAFWLHDLPIHPAILPGIGRPDKAPAAMTILSYTPKYPNGIKAYWTLTDSDIRPAPFPLSASTASGISVDETTPLAFAIALAAKGEALPGRPNADNLREDIHSKREAGKNFEAWISAQTLAHKLGGCENDPALLCEDIKALETGANPNDALGELLAILALANTKSTQAEGFEALIPYISDQIAPAFLVKIAGQTRSRIRDSALSSDTARALTAEGLLTEALLKDPYDGETYLTLAQVYAAQERYAESWDMQDALRNLPGAAPELATSVNRAEASIKRIAPGFFVPKVP